MPDDRGKLKKLHENLVRDGYALPDYATFEKDMSDSNNLKKLHGTLVNDGYELPDEMTFRSDMGYGEVKKKDWVSRIFGGEEKPTSSNGLSGGLLGSAAQKSEKERLADYVTGLKTPEEKSYSEQPEAIVTTTFKKNEKPFDQTREEAIGNSKKVLNEIMYADDDRWKDPIKSSISGIDKSASQKESLAYYGAKTLTEDSLMPDGFEANRVLSSTHFGKEGDDNLTAKALRNKVADYEKTVAPFREINPEELTYLTKDNIYDAAIRAYANNNPHFKKQLESAGVDITKDNLRLSMGDSDAKVGQIMSTILQNPDLHTFLQKENPALLPAMQDIHENLIYDNKDYGRVQLANEISRDMQAGGYNKIDPFFNLEGSAKKTGDVTAEALYANDPKKLQFYRENKDEILNKLDAPSLFSSFAESGKGFGKSILKSFTEPFTSTSKTIKEGWEKEASHVSADPTGLVKFLSDSGHALGFVAAIGATGNVLGATGLSRSGAEMTSLGIGFLGENLEQAKMKYPDSPIKQWSSALFNTGLYMAMGKSLFPAAKVEQALAKVQPGVSNVIENLASGKITREAARAELNSLGKKAIDIAGIGLQKNLKVSAEMTGITILNKTLDKLMGMDDQTFAQYHPEGEEADTAKSMFLSNVIVNSLAAYGQVKAKNNFAKESIYEAASYPKRYRDIIESSEISKNVTDTKDMLDNLDYISGIKKELDAMGLSEKQKKDYLFNAIKSKVLMASKPQSPDATLTRSHAERIKELEEVNQGILEGKDADEIVTTSEQKIVDEQQKQKEQIEKNDTETERLTKAKELDEKEFSEKRAALDGRRPEDRIKIEKLEQAQKEKNEDYDNKLSKLMREKGDLQMKQGKVDETFLKEQSLDAPNGLVAQLGSKEAVVDIISKQNPEEIEAAIKVWEDRIKDGFVTAEDADKHITLLEKGLEAAKPNTQTETISETASPELKVEAGSVGVGGDVISGDKVWDIAVKGGSETGDFSDMEGVIKNKNYIKTKVPINKLIENDEQLREFLETEPPKEKGRDITQPIIVTDIPIGDEMQKDGVADGFNRIAQAIANGDKEIDAYVNSESNLVKPKAVEQSLKAEDKAPVTKAEGAGSSGVGDFTAKGGNKVVDDKGEPLEVYHGTSKAFDDLDANKPQRGLFFTSNKKTASSYANTGGDNPRIISVNLNLKNPHIIDAKGKSYDNILVALNKAGDDGKGVSKVMSTDEIVEALRGMRSESIVTNLYGTKTKADGIIIKNVKDALTNNLGDVADIYIPFSNEQVKNLNPKPKAEDKAPVTKPEGKSDVVVDKASNVGEDVDFTSKGGNKVVDEKGEPITVYHGTSEDFDAFDKNAKSKSNHPSSKLGIFFTVSEKLANLFNRDTDGVGGFPDYKNLPPKKGAKVVKANISIKNPKVFTAKEYKALMVSEDYSKTSDANDYIKLRDKLIGEGYDGIKIENDFHNEIGEYQSDQYVAFEPSQIKLIKDQSLSKQESGGKAPVTKPEGKSDVVGNQQKVETKRVEKVAELEAARDMAILREKVPEMGKADDVLPSINDVVAKSKSGEEDTNLAERKRLKDNYNNLRKLFECLVK